MKLFSALLGLLVLLLATACEDDPVGGCYDCCKSGDCGENPLDLSERWEVLNNIEYAYKVRRSDVYDELLSADFTFFFSAADVSGGLPASWTRADEIDATTRLFLSNEQTQPPTDPITRSMRLDLPFDKSTLTWVEIQPSAYPAEKWYSTTVFYTFTFEIEPNTTYIAVNGARAEFVVRNNPQGDKARWELVEFRDLGDDKPPVSVQSTQEATWGAIKSLYSPSS